MPLMNENFITKISLNRKIKRQKEILELKSYISEIKNSLNKLKSQMGMVAEKVTEHEYKSVEITQDKEHKGKKIFLR